MQDNYQHNETATQDFATDTQCQVDANEIRDLIDKLPVEHRYPMTQAFERLLVKLDEQKKILVYAQDVLGQLRLDMYYLQFDLEATRRERDHYQSQLNE